MNFSPNKGRCPKDRGVGRIYMKNSFINIHSHTPLNFPDLITIYNLIPGEISYENYFSAGIHPWFIDELNFENQLKNLEVILQNKYCIFIGECGLDKLKCSDFAIQQKVFSAQINLAVKFGKPMIIHCVKAFDETISLFKNKISSDKIIFHGFHKSAELALDLTSEGFYISLGKIFFSHPEKAKVILEKVNHEKLFLETDDMDISIEEIYQKASELSGKPPHFWREQMHTNFNCILV